MIVNAFSILEKLIMGSYQYRVVTETILDGEAMKTYAAPVNIRCGVLPMTGQELKNTQEGQYSFEDKIVLTEAGCPIKIGDAVIADGKAFEVKIEIDVGSIAGLKKYIVKRIACGDALVAELGPVTYNAGWTEFINEFEEGLL